MLPWSYLFRIHFVIFTDMIWPEGFLCSVAAIGVSPTKTSQGICFWRALSSARFRPMSNKDDPFLTVKPLSSLGHNDHLRLPVSLCLSLTLTLDLSSTTFECQVQRSLSLSIYICLNLCSLSLSLSLPPSLSLSLSLSVSVSVSVSLSLSLCPKEFLGQRNCRNFENPWPDFTHQGHLTLFLSWPSSSPINVSTSLGLKSFQVFENAFQDFCLS